MVDDFALGRLRIEFHDGDQVVPVSNYIERLAVQQDAVAVPDLLSPEVDLARLARPRIDPVEQAGGRVHDEQVFTVRRRVDAVRVEPLLILSDITT